MSETKPLHIVAVAYGGWGHIRPLCTLATRLVRLRRATVTLLVSRHVYAKAAAELVRNFEDGEDALQAQIRLAALDAHATDLYDYDVVGAAFAQEYPKLVRGAPMRCAHTHAELPALPPPQALILDLMHYALLPIARAASASIKVLCSGPPSILSTYLLVGTLGSRSGGRTVAEEKIEGYAAQKGLSLREAADAMFNEPPGDVIQAAGLPPMYWYENTPQTPVIQVKLGFSRLLVIKLVNECDAYISSSMECFEPKESVQGFSEFFARTSRKLYLLGPLMPMTKRSDAADAAQAAQSPEIVDFLQNALQKHGERSMVYMSFGTFFWTAHPEKAWAFLDVLMEKKIPFIMSHASQLAHVPDEVKAKVKASGTGLLVPWAPQQAILEHPATGWFVTHAGFNSIVESIYAGVPMICWPFSADQPLNAMHITENLDIAYELFEVRTGPGLKPVHRTGKAPVGTLDAVRAEAAAVLARAFGDDGAQKRERVRRLREAMLEPWQPGGAAWVAGEQLLDSLQ
ncbi:glycosyltransferase family 1 protein [Phanerochaete sordida]|uniref:Glycosyltransferase family 1 protein n=1 Tax=Phanerochaete sordida TaxID=48140 RepID=A0A9P3G463_9APHY|nr:glycosyltransferase family 1 protein [Phanerochaete sordida]